MAQFFKKSGLSEDGESLTTLEKRIAAVLGRKADAAGGRRLLEAVMLRVGEETRARKFRKDLVFAGAFAASVCAFMLSWAVFRTEAQSSGFMALASLLLSDTATVLGDWKNYALSILESFPFAAIFGALGSLWFAVLFLKYLIESLEGYPLLFIRSKHV